MFTDLKLIRNLHPALFETRSKVSAFINMFEKIKIFSSSVFSKQLGIHASLIWLMLEN